MTILTEQQIELFSQFHTAIQDQVSDRRKQKMADWDNVIATKHHIIISGSVDKKGKLTGYQLLRNWEPVISGLSWKQIKLAVRLLKML